MVFAILFESDLRVIIPLWAGGEEFLWGVAGDDWDACADCDASAARLMLISIAL